MRLNEYQRAALETAVYSPDYAIVYPVLGLTGESGEVADKIKKVLRDDDGEFTADKRTEIAKELGDVLWYLSSLAYDLGYTLDDIAQMNIDKLRSRRERGVVNGSGDNR